MDNYTLESLEGRVTNIGQRIMALSELERSAHQSHGKRRLDCLNSLREDYDELRKTTPALTPRAYEYVYERLETLKNPKKSRAPPGWRPGLPDPQWRKLFLPIGVLERELPKRHYRLSFTRWMHESPYHGVVHFVGDYVMKGPRKGENVQWHGVGRKLLVHLEDAINRYGFTTGLALPTFEEDIKKYYKTNRDLKRPVEDMIEQIPASWVRDIIREGCLWRNQTTIKEFAIFFGSWTHRNLSNAKERQMYEEVDSVLARYDLKSYMIDPDVYRNRSNQG